MLTLSLNIKSLLHYLDVMSLNIKSLLHDSENVIEHFVVATWPKQCCWTLGDYYMTQILALHIK